MGRSAATLLIGFVWLASCAADSALARQPVPVPRVVIYPGDAIAESHLEDRDVGASGQIAATHHTARGTLVGRIARRTLLPGQPIPLGAVKEADLVRAGKPVTIVFTTGALTITGRGVAMQAGASGDLVSVQNLDSGTVVRGLVGADGTVRVGD